MIKKLVLNNLSFAVLLFFIGFILFYKLGNTYLTNWDEAWYGDISATMAKTGNFLTPFWNKEPFFEKPPLYFWSSSLFFKIFGVSEFSVRLTSVVAALGIAFVVYFIASQFLTKKSGLISLVILFSSVEFLYRSRTGNLDTLLALFMTSSIFFFFKAISADRRWFGALGVSLGLGFLSKGFIAFYPLVIILLFLSLNKKFDMFKDKWFLLNILVAFGISGGWFLSYFLANGKPFIDQFLLANTEKFGFNLNLLSNFSIDYLGYLKNGLKIWFPFAIFSFIYLFIKIRNQVISFLLIYLAVFLLVLSFSHEKSNWFILPLYPIFSLITAYGILSFAKLKVRQLEVLLFVVLSIIALFQLFVYRKSYIVPNVSADEAKSALIAKQLTKENQPIYLTNYYYPTTIYYSQRKVYALYSDQEDNASWWIKSKSYWSYVFRNKNIIIITTKQELRELKERFPQHIIDILFVTGDKIVAKKV